MAADQLLQLGFALVALSVLGTAAYRYDQSVIPAYIVAGILIGPHVPTEIGGVTLALVTEGEFMHTAAELGIIFLLFFLGLEFHISTLLENWRKLLAVGSIDLAINVTVGLALGLAFGFGPVTTLLIAGIVYISSSAIITKSLTANGWLANPESDVILGTLVVEDILIAIYLAIVSAVILGGGSLAGAIASIGQAFVFLGVIVVGGYYAATHVERLLRVDVEELFLLRVLAVTICVGAAALLLGLSEAVAAFFVGTVINQTALVERIERGLLPFRDVFAALFFFSIGLATDLTVVRSVWFLLVTATVITLVSKLASGYLSGLVYGLDRRRSVRTGIGLVARGEFSLIVATLATTVGGTAASVVPSFAAGYVLVMSLLGTVSIQRAPAIVRFVDRAAGGDVVNRPTAE